jgi:hypothetical protein
MTEIEFVRAVAEAVLRRLGDDLSHWRVLDVRHYQEPLAAPAGLSPSDSLLVTIGTDTDQVGVYFSRDVSRQQAVEAMAGQIQDHAIERAHGRPLPPCPGHGHPLSTGWVAGVASWVCPRDPAHHHEPIVAG